MVAFRFIIVVLLAALAGASTAQRLTYRAPQHTRAPLPVGATPEDFVAFANGGMQIERDRAPDDQLAEHRRLVSALDGLLPQRKGVVDAYVVSIALDSDPVFGREAREAGKVLARRYDAVGRTIVFAGSDGTGPSDLPRGSPDHLSLAVARIAELMDRSEDVLVLYTTSHGAPIGIIYNDADQGYGAISPNRLAAVLGALGIDRRLVIVSACYSGNFVPALANADTAILTASSGDRTSFGCQSDNDWTFYGDALINHALRKAQSISAASSEALTLVNRWESNAQLKPSYPQTMIGANATRWLEIIDRRAPKTSTEPVGRPATTLLEAK
ncbi:MAG: C13 family peptidase [Sphingomonas sp.]|nr:C13 family peptidase [Sphingomonas sp.]